MNTFEKIEERVWDYIDVGIVVFPDDTAKFIISALEYFIEELKRATDESCVKDPYSVVVVNTVMELLASSVSDLKRMLLMTKATNGNPDVNSLRELIYSARLSGLIAGRAVTDNDHVFKQTSMHDAIEGCLSAILVLLHKLVLLHDQHGWVTNSAVYSEN